LPQISNAATEYTTFASFYRPSTNTIWILAGAAAAALIAGAVIFFTGGAASPVVVSTGTWIGGLMGYSGAAATNAGLALLGGGSIASGGFGIIGGTALLTATFSFGTGVVVDYAVDSALVSYDYSKFVENSKKMTTLPLPKNKSGPDSYESAIKVLDKTNNEEPLSSNHNQGVIKKAITVINTFLKDDLSEKEKSKEQSLLALLYFITNDYTAAKKHAQIAYKLARNSNRKATFPAFISATSSLYETKPNIQTSAQYFQYAVMGEPDNPMTPLLFAIYLDRMMYRFNDGYLTSSELRKVYTFSDKLPYDERKAIVQLGIVSRDFILIKLEQQKILSLTQGNKTIKSSPKTLVSVKRALKEYKSLLGDIKASLDQQSNVLEHRLKHKPKFWDKVTGKGIQQWEIQWNDKITELSTLLSSYRDGVTGLESSIRELERYQAELKRLRLQKEKLNRFHSQEVQNDKNWSGWYYLALIAGLLLGSLYLLRKPEAR
jgi:tetratricopeptide (TPR) repeat protein